MQETEWADDGKRKYYYLYGMVRKGKETRPFKRGPYNSREQALGAFANFEQPPVWYDVAEITNKADAGRILRNKIMERDKSVEVMFQNFSSVVGRG